MEILRSLSRAGLASVAFCVLSSVIALLVSAWTAYETLSIAIGCNILPGAPTDSIILGPIIIGVQISWEFGLIATPMLYAFANGPLADWHWARIAKAGGIGMAASALAVLAASGFLGHWEDGLGIAVLVTILDYGFQILTIGLITMALMLRRWSKVTPLAITSPSSEPS